jgi:hypothetical protein
VQGVGCRVLGVGFRVQGVWCRTGARSMRARELRSRDPGSVRREPITTHAIECELQPRHTPSALSIHDSLSIYLSIDSSTSIQSSIYLSIYLFIYMYMDAMLSEQCCLTQCIHHLILESQPPHKTVSSIIQLVVVNDKLTISWGS